MLRVVLIDDDRVLASTWTELLRRRKIQLVATASSVADGAQMCADHRPNVVLVDWDLPGANGTEFIRQLRTWPTRPRSILISAYSYVDMVEEAVDAGADGFFDKMTSDFHSLCAAIEAVAERRGYFCPCSRALMAKAERRAALTAQERRILHRLAAYARPAQIARIEGLARSTIAEHCARIARKLEVAEETPQIGTIVAAGRRHGWLPRR